MNNIPQVNLKSILSSAMALGPTGSNNYRNLSPQIETMTDLNGRLARREGKLEALRGSLTQVPEAVSKPLTSVLNPHYETITAMKAFVDETLAKLNVFNELVMQQSDKLKNIIIGFIRDHQIDIDKEDQIPQAYRQEATLQGIT